MTLLFNNFLEWLQNVMIHKYDIERIRFQNSVREDVDRVIWVHELCECPEKARLENYFPQLSWTVRFKPAVMLGELVHVALEQWSFEYTPQVYHKTLDVDGEFSAHRTGAIAAPCAAGAALHVAVQR